MDVYIKVVFCFFLLSISLRHLYYETAFLSYFRNTDEVVVIKTVPEEKMEVKTSASNDNNNCEW